MLPANFDEIKPEDLLRLVSDKTPEGRLLEYKRELSIQSSSEKREIASDISSFANAAGGDLVYGVAEETGANGKATGCPESAPGIQLNGATPDDLVRRVHLICQQGLDPAIPGLRIRTLALNSQIFLLVRVPRSWLAPHMVSLDGVTKFALRVDNAKVWMDREQIRQAFLFAESARTNIERFRDNRLSRIISGEIGVPLEATWKRVLHLVPIAGLNGSYSVDLASFFPLAGTLPQLASDFSSIRPNIDGALLAEDCSGGNKCHRLLQVFRNGAIEYIRTGYLHPNANNIHGASFENYLFKDFDRCAAFYRSQSAPSPLVAMLSLLDVKGRYLLNPEELPHQFPEHVFDRAIIILPELTLDDYTKEAKTLLLPPIDTFWQAGGHRRSPSFPREA